MGDIDYYVLYLEDDSEQSIDLSNVLRSYFFQKMVVEGHFEVTDNGNSRIERNLRRLRSAMAKIQMISDKVEDTPKTIEDDDSLSVVIKGHFMEGGGYAKVNRNLTKGLVEAGINTSIDVIGSPKPEITEEEMSFLRSLQSKKTGSSVRIDSIVPSFAQQSHGKRTILYTTIESATINKQFAECCNMYSEVWVTSDFCKDVLSKHIDHDIKVLPDSIDTYMYTEDGQEYQFKPKLKKFVFVSVFGWSYRKGYDALLRSYLEEFSGKEDVSLLLVTKFQGTSGRSEFIRDIVNEYIAKYGGEYPAHIARCSKAIPEDQMPDLYRACDAYVSLSRGEGFNLPCAESSLCGLPVIAINFGGHTMFMKNNNSYLIDIDHLAKVIPGQMHVHYWDGQMFPALITDDFISRAKSSMREVYENYNEAKKKNKKLSRFLRQNYSIEKVAEKAISYLGATK